MLAQKFRFRTPNYFDQGATGNVFEDLKALRSRSHSACCIVVSTWFLIFRFHSHFEHNIAINDQIALQSNCKDCVIWLSRLHSSPPPSERNVLVTTMCILVI